MSGIEHSACSVKRAIVTHVVSGAGGVVQIAVGLVHRQLSAYGRSTGSRRDLCCLLSHSLKIRRKKMKTNETMLFFLFFSTVLSIVSADCESTPGYSSLTLGGWS